MFVSCAHAPVTSEPRVVEVMLQHVKRDGPNHRHMLRLAKLSARLSKAAGADARIVETAALLHDATKEDGQGAPYERFCTHHLQAAALARQSLPGLGFSPLDTERVAQAIEQHMGPLGDNEEFHAPRFMSGFCKREFPRPATIEAKVLFDLDMLDLMTVDGVVKVVTLRQRNPEFAKEPVRDSALTGADSAWKSVVDARQVLLTPTGQRCGDEVQRHTRAFLDQVPFETVTTVESFEETAHSWLAAHALPPCVTP